MQMSTLGAPDLLWAQSMCVIYMQNDLTSKSTESVHCAPHLRFRINKMASCEGHSSRRASDGQLPKYFEFIFMHSSIPKPIGGASGKTEGERCKIIGHTFCMLNLLRSLRLHMSEFIECKVVT